MDEQLLDRLMEMARRLPAADVRRLADAAGGGIDQLQQLKSASGSPALRQACDDLVAALQDGGGGGTVCGALRGAVAMRERMAHQTSIDVVWTGPSSHVETGRLTSAVVTSLIGEAHNELLLVGYAVHTEAAVVEALGCASEAGVDITLLLERSVDNPRYSGSGTAFPQLDAHRLAWPAAQRPASGAALHAKVLVVDRRVALVGSANITGWALERNLECGLLVRDRRVAKSICAHVESLRSQGTLLRVGSS